MCPPRPPGCRGLPAAGLFPPDTSADVTPGTQHPSPGNLNPCPPRLPDDVSDQEGLDLRAADKGQVSGAVLLAVPLCLLPLGLLHHQPVAVVVARENQAIGGTHGVNRCERQKNTNVMPFLWDHNPQPNLGHKTPGPALPGASKSHSLLNCSLCSPVCGQALGKALLGQPG